MYEARAGENVGSMIDTIHKAGGEKWALQGIMKEIG